MAKDINRKVTIYVNGKAVENTIKSLRAELRRLENAQKDCIIGSDEYERIKKSIPEHTCPHYEDLFDAAWAGRFPRKKNENCVYY